MSEHTLTNMKIDPKARENTSAASPAGGSDQPIYPWGLQVTLDNEALETLGLERLPQVGTSMRLFAYVDVTSVSETEHTEGGKKTMHRSVSLQMTDLALEPKTAKRADADVLYGDD